MSNPRTRKTCDIQRNTPGFGTWYLSYHPQMAILVKTLANYKCPQEYKFDKSRSTFSLDKKFINQFTPLSKAKTIIKVRNKKLPTKKAVGTPQTI